ncbi:MAG: hypothetical protein ABIN67_12465 [Ferruginibacter sp.]
MQAKTKSDFKAVDFMRQVRNELSTLMQTDPKRFHDELKQTMAEFIAKRQQATRQQGIAKSGAEE